MLVVACRGCQTRLKVPDNLAGKKAKCPKCQGVLNIPSAEETVEFPPNRAVTPPSSRLPARGAPLPKEIDEPRPARSKTDKNRKEVLDELDEPRPRLVEDDLAEDPPRRPRDDDDDFEEDRPRRRRKKAGVSPLLLYGSIGSGALLVLVIVGVLLVLLGGESVGLRFMPDDPHFIIAIRPAEIAASATFKELEKSIPNFQNLVNSKLHEEIGLSISDIGFIQIGASSPNNVCFLMRLNKDEKIDNLLMKKGGPQNFNSITVGTYTIRDKNNEGICLIDNRMIVAGPTEYLKIVLQRNRNATLSPEMQRAIVDVDSGATVVMVGDARKLQTNMGGGGMPGIGRPGFNFMEGFNEIKEVEHFATEVRIASDVSAKVVATYKDESRANKLKTLVDAQLPALKVGMGAKLPPSGKAALESITTTLNGPKVIMTGRIALGSFVKEMEKQGVPLGMPFNLFGGLSGGGGLAKEKAFEAQPSIPWDTCHRLVMGPNRDANRDWRCGLILFHSLPRQMGRFPLS